MRQRLFDRSVLARFGVLYRLYRPRFYFYTLALLGKRLVLVLSSVFLSRIQSLQLPVFVLVLGASMLFAFRYQPYDQPFYTRVELLLDGVLVAVMLVGAATYLVGG